MAMSSLAQKARRRSNMARTWNKSKVFLFLLIMVLVGAVLVFPYFYMVSKSLMSSSEVVDTNVPLLPSSPQFNNYLSIFTNANYLKALGNTCIIIGFNIVATLISASLIAFSFAKLEWVGKRVMFILMMFTMMLPAVATQIPLYVMYAKWHWIDTLLPLTIPNLFGGGAVYIFLLRQYMMGIPNNMIDAAKADGASMWKIYWHIILPNCKPILIYIGVTILMTNWGDFYGPLVYLTSDNAPRTLAYYVFLNSTEGDAAAQMAHIRMAAGVFMTLVPAIVFGIFQKQLTDGVLTTGRKG